MKNGRNRTIIEKGLTTTVLGVLMRESLEHELSGAWISVGAGVDVDQLVSGLIQFRRVMNHGDG